MNLITAILEVVKQLLCVKNSEITYKPILDAIKDKRNLKKATNITEDILKITDKYLDSFDKKDLKKYQKLKDKFQKFN